MSKLPKVLVLHVHACMHLSSLSLSTLCISLSLSYFSNQTHTHTHIELGIGLARQMDRSLRLDFYDIETIHYNHLTLSNIVIFASSFVLTL